MRHRSSWPWHWMDPIVRHSSCKFAGLGVGGGGIRYRDSASSANHGAISPAIATGPQWQWSCFLKRWALDYAAASDYVLLDTPAVTGYPASFAAWVYISSSLGTWGDGCIIGSSRPGTSNNSIGLVFRNGASVRSFGFITHGTVRSVNITGDARDEWLHVAVTLPGTATNACKLYFNGVEISTATGVSIALTPTQGSLGDLERSLWNNPFNGIAADPLAFDRVLTPREVEMLANPRFQLVSQPLVYRYVAEEEATRVPTAHFTLERHRPEFTLSPGDDFTPAETRPEFTLAERN